jgi:hypothetical protein
MRLVRVISTTARCIRGAVPSEDVIERADELSGSSRIKNPERPVECIGSLMRRPVLVSTGIDREVIGEEGPARNGAVQTVVEAFVDRGVVSYEIGARAGAQHTSQRCAGVGELTAKVPANG